MVFLHNVITASLIIIGMTFYVDFLDKFPPRKYIEYVVANHPRLFAIIFTTKVQKDW